MAATLRDSARALALRVLSWRKLGAAVQPGIRFVCYHDVLDHEVGNLETQLLSMRRLGRFVSLDEAIDMMARQSGLDRPTFTVTFDDGLATTHRNAWPVFERLGIPLSIFAITSFMGEEGYLTWGNIAEMAASPLVTFGSHTVHHRNLAQLAAEEVRAELEQSKARIEQALQRRCDHFCCPWGRPGRDFVVDRDPAIAVEVGYRSFLTTERGLTRAGDRLPTVKRDVLHMHSSPAELRHFLY